MFSMDRILLFSVILSSTTYHTNFKIGFGETVTLYDADGGIIDTITVDYMLPGHSIMRTDDSGTWCLTDSSYS